MKNPCWDENTNTSCPDRYGGCHVTCPDWAKYVKERNHSYDVRQAQKNIDYMVVDIFANRRKSHDKEYMHSIRTKRKRW